MSVHFSSITDSWSTPRGLYMELDKEFSFNFDPCPLDDSYSDPTQMSLLVEPDPKAARADGLACEWGTSTFCNPPYSELALWLKKAFQEWRKGKTVVMLIPSRTDTAAWHDYVMRATEIRFLRGRLKFGDSENSAPFPSCVVVFK